MGRPIGRDVGAALAACALAISVGLPGLAAAAEGQPAPPAAGSASVPAGSVEDELRALRAKLAELEAWKEEQELQALQREAEDAAREAPPETLSLRSFKGGERALQALNPEISVTGDLYVQALLRDGQDYESDPPTEFGFRGLGLHLQANLDPFSFMKAAISFAPDGVGFGEAYATWTNVLPHLNLTAGKFRQQLGVVNRWHKHGLDWFDFPLMLTEPFGPAGLSQIGVALEWFLPALWAHEQSLELQVTNGTNPRVFDRDGATFSIPAVLVRLRSYWDLNRDTYLDLGLTGLFGWNDAHAPGYQPAGTATAELTGPDGALLHVLTETPAVGVPNEDWHLSAFAGADLSLVWEPLNRAKYAGVTWRTEFLYARKELPARATIETFGGYTSLEVRVWQNWHVGVRGDLVERFACGADDELVWQVSPWVTWWQSPWARLHLEYQFLDGSEDTFVQQHRVVLQAVFAAGPHKHDRY